MIMLHKNCVYVAIGECSASCIGLLQNLAASACVMVAYACC